MVSQICANVKVVIMLLMSCCEWLQVILATLVSYGLGKMGNTFDIATVGEIPTGYFCFLHSVMLYNNITLLCSRRAVGTLGCPLRECVF